MTEHFLVVRQSVVTTPSPLPSRSLTRTYKGRRGRVKTKPDDLVGDVVLEAWSAVNREEHEQAESGVTGSDNDWQEEGSS